MPFRAWTRAALDIARGDGESNYLTWQVICQVPPLIGQQLTVVRTILDLSLVEEGQLPNATKIPQYPGVGLMAYVEFAHAMSGDYPTPPGWPDIATGDEFHQPVLAAGMVPRWAWSEWTDQVPTAPAVRSTFLYSYSYALAGGPVDSHAQRHYGLGPGESAYAVTANIAIKSPAAGPFEEDVAASGMISVLLQYDRDAAEG